MANITYLPYEIVRYILTYIDVSFSDIVNFSLTCKQFYTIVSDDNLWRKKLLQRSPYLEKVYSKRHTNFRDEVKASRKCKHKLMHLLCSISEQYKNNLSRCEISNIEELVDPEKGHPMNYYFVVDELTTLLKQPLWRMNLTHRYYGIKILRHLKQHHLQQKWCRMMYRNPETQILERIATFVSNWSQPEQHTSYSYIATLLDNIAQHALDDLKSMYPTHPIFKATPNDFSYWKRSNINDNQWSPTNTRQIIDVLCNLMFKKLGFHGSDVDFCDANSALIDHVLITKQGAAISLAIIFESVARRLGVHCEIITFPSHLFLSWRESYNRKDCKNTECFYIDVFNHGNILTKKNCPKIGQAETCPMKDLSILDKIIPAEVVLRLTNILQMAARQHFNLSITAVKIRSALELQLFVETQFDETLIQLTHHLRLYDMYSTEDLLSIIDRKYYSNDHMRLRARRSGERILENLLYLSNDTVRNPIQVIPKQRTAELLFAVGLTMVFTQYNKPYICVVAGWDVNCEGEPPVQWCNDMNLLFKNQPFYTILIEDGRTMTVPQRTLSMTYPRWIDHTELGRYFYKFSNDHYEPNEMLALEYPDDTYARHECISLYYEIKCIVD